MLSSAQVAQLQAALDNGREYTVAAEHDPSLLLLEGNHQLGVATLFTEPIVYMMATEVSAKRNEGLGEGVRALPFPCRIICVLAYTHPSTRTMSRRLKRKRPAAARMSKIHLLLSLEMPLLFVTKMETARLRRQNDLERWVTSPCPHFRQYVEA